MSADSIAPTPVRITWSRISGGIRRGARARWVDSIHGARTNWTKVKGSSTRMKPEPVRRTTTEKVRPRSEAKAMSP